MCSDSSLGVVEKSLYDEVPNYAGTLISTGLIPVSEG
jgi:hypothetical protein